MPWAEGTRVSLREEFVQLAMQPGVNRRELCRRFGISPKTANKTKLHSASSSCGVSCAIRGAGASVAISYSSAARR
jgi:transposase-like protein